MDNVTEKNTEDEISLVDLIVVLLKRRYLILGSVAAAVIVFLVWNFNYPAYLRAKYADENQNKRGIETNLTVMANPTLNSLFESAVENRKEVSTVASQIFRDPILLIAALRKAGISELDGKDLPSLSDAELAYIVRQLLVDGKSLEGSSLSDAQKPFLVKQSDAALILTFRHTDMDKAKAFLLEVYRLADASAMKLYAPLATAAVEDYERFSRLPLSSALDQTNAAAYYASYSVGRRLLDGSLKPFLQIGEPYQIVTTPEPPSAPKVAVIFVFAAFFLSVFAAFVLEYIDHLKNDPESRAKIDAALAKGKKSAKRN